MLLRIGTYSISVHSPVRLTSLFLKIGFFALDFVLFYFVFDVMCKPSDYPYHYLYIKFKLLWSTRFQFCWFVVWKPFQSILILPSKQGIFFIIDFFVSAVPRVGLMFYIKLLGNNRELTVWWEFKIRRVQSPSMIFSSFPAFLWTSQSQLLSSES